jgi:membrane-bound serine protease (ClpP class)
LDFSFVDPSKIMTAVFTTVIALGGAIVLMFVGGANLTNTQMFKRVALQNEMTKEEGFTSNFKKEVFTGKKGVAYTILRPSGKISIDGEIYDAYTRGNYVEKGTEVEVISDEGTSLKVKEVS